nr:zinc finger, CCHC-type [Tanacetum cinerariifolium]
MSDSLFDVYTNVESAKELWDSLESKYMAEDSSSKKFFVSNFNNYKMVDSKPVMEQYNELLRILGQYTQYGLKMDESIYVSSIIDKLHPSWKDFKRTLKHGKDDLSLVQLEIDKVVKRTTQMLLVWERGLRTNPKTKWIDSGATTHVCKDRCWFKTYEPVEDGSVLYMGDDYFAPVHGKGSVALEFSFGKTITLFNVLYVPKLRKNLVSGPMLNKCGYKQVYESNKYILSKSGVFVGFGYYNNGIFMFNMNNVPDDSDSVYMSSFTVVNFSLWHARLGHVRYKRLLDMSKDDLIPAIDENPEQYTTCMLTKIIRKPFQRIIHTPQQNGVAERKIDLLRKWLIPCYLTQDPRTYNEAMQSRDSTFWKEAIDDEIGSIMKNSTWVLSDLPPGYKPLGFRQKEGIDYFDTYAPVACITTIRLLLALAAIHNPVIHQMDVKTRFLNGDLDEEVYMKQPKGFIMPGNEHKVCKLVKSLYELKQAPKQWHKKFDEVVLSSGFHLNQSVKCVYSKFDDSGKGVIICLYVDDMLIFGTDQNQVDKTKKFLSSRFSMKDMGEADVILGIKIKRENKGIVVTQSHYIEKILKKFNHEDCSLLSTPINLIEKLKPNTGKPVDQLKCSRAISCLMYAMTSTRLDIAYAVGRLSSFTSNPSRQHWKAITRVFKYLRGTKDYGLSYVRYPSVLEGYSDAS